MHTQARNDDVIAALLLLLADLIRLMASSSSQEQQKMSRELVSFVISRRIKVCYSRSASLAAVSDKHTDA